MGRREYEYLEEGDLEEAKVWALSGNQYYSSPTTVPKLKPGPYTISHEYGMGIVFTPSNLKDEKLIRFPDHTTSQIVQEIKDFWARRELFKKFGILHKRGIFLYGPPGTGKSCALQLVMEEVTKLGGISITEFPRCKMFVEGMKLFRTIQPETPVVVIMEDLDAIMADQNESRVLNVLDGVDSFDNVVYLATTNHPENFESRIIDRPSRFDRRFEIGYPSPDIRFAYLVHLTKGYIVGEMLEKWVADTEMFSLAHLKELFIAVVILEHPYDEVLEELRHMAIKVGRSRARDEIDEDEDEEEDEEE